MLAEVLLVILCAVGAISVKDRYSVEINALTWRARASGNSCSLYFCLLPSFPAGMRGFPAHGGQVHPAGSPGQPNAQEAGREKGSSLHNNVASFAASVWFCLCCCEQDLVARSRGMGTVSTHEQGSWQMQEKEQGPDHYHRWVLELWATNPRRAGDFHRAQGAFGVGSSTVPLSRAFCFPCSGQKSPM